MSHNDLGSNRDRGKNNLKATIAKTGLKKKCQNLQDTSIKTITDPKIENETPATDENEPQISISQKLPKILPRKCSANNGTENTIVVLPAAPYMFPPRPLLFPTMPPAFVLVDSNLQHFNKSPVPIVCSRSNGDITKTTMVNILPISAYSRPLSANKVKRNGLKAKNEKTLKKTNKKIKIINPPGNTKNDPKVNKENIEKPESVTNSKEIKNTTEDCIDKTSKDAPISKPNDSDKHIVSIKAKNNDAIESTENVNESEPKKDEVLKNTAKEEQVATKSDINLSSISTTAISTSTVDKSTNIPKENNMTAVTFDKKSLNDNKDGKLTNILDTSLCEHTADGGNARLELAEELLAASPTAAFLMSFPLVSGNRADSPTEEAPSLQQPNKDSNQRKNDLTVQSVEYFEKPNEVDNKQKPINKTPNQSNYVAKQPKSLDNTTNKQTELKNTSQAVINISTDNPFLNLQVPSLTSTACTISDSNFGLDFDCNINKSMSNQPSNYSNNSIFYKNDPLNAVKSTIYSTSTIASGHEFSSLGLYPCAMEKYATKTKPEYGTVEDNLIKMGSSRLTYDIDLGWSHKSLDFASCSTVTNTTNKDHILTTTTSTYSTSYNPFNPEFHMPFVANANKKDFPSKASTSFSDTITSFYSQPPNLWSEEVPFYSSNSISKTLTAKDQNYNIDYSLSNSIQGKTSSIVRQFETKHNTENNYDHRLKSSSTANQITDKFSKKTNSNKVPINWMTSEIRTMQNCNTNPLDAKVANKASYGQQEHIVKKLNQTENNCFPVAGQNFTPQVNQDEFQMWPLTRPLGTTEISIEPPVNLPTLVGDLALGPHDKKKNAEAHNRSGIHNDLQGSSNFLSVTQLMNRSTDNMSSRYQDTNIETSKSALLKQNIVPYPNDNNRKTGCTRVDNILPQPCYAFNDSKPVSSYENVNHYSHNKLKPVKSEKTKVQKHSYSAEALMRSGTCTQKVQDNTKFMGAHQKYGDYVSHDASVAQVSHFPQILDYSENSYSQQFVGTTLYNTTSNTMSNSFYSNFIPGSNNIVPSNYTNNTLASEYVDYNQSTECNYTNHKYDDIKMRNNSMPVNQEKATATYKSSRRENTAKHKLECSKKESSKKYQNKRPKLNGEVEEWTDASNLLWQNKTPNKRHSNLMSEELPYNYVGNQVSAQYQPEYFNSHLISSNMQAMGHNIDRSFSSFPATSRANFNLSTIFPEITMKVPS